MSFCRYYYLVLWISLYLLSYIWNVYELSLYCRLVVEFIRVITELYLSNPTFAHDYCWESRMYSGRIWHLCLLIKNTNLVVLFIVITHYDKSRCCIPRSVSCDLMQCGSWWSVLLWKTGQMRLCLDLEEANKRCVALELPKNLLTGLFSQLDCIDLMHCSLACRMVCWPVHPADPLYLTAKSDLISATIHAFNACRQCIQQVSWGNRNKEQS